MSLNVAVIEGRLVRDPEVRKTPSDVSVVTITVAVDRKYKSGEDKQADFIRATAWSGTADFIGKYFRKGDGIHVVGRIQTESYQDKEGNNRTITEVLVDNVGFPVSSRKERDANVSADASKTDAETVQNVSKALGVSASDINVIVDDGDLPF